MFQLSILSMFKNEDMIIENWFQHYLEEGVEHFYLIDNGSTDNYEEKIKKYQKYYTLVKDPTRLPSGTQTFLYNKHYLHKVKQETIWLIICDIDEYIYGRNGCIKITDALNKLPSNVEKIWLPWKCFGSNERKIQPKNIIFSFNKCNDIYSHKKDLGFGKTVLKTKHLEEIQTCGHIVKLKKNNVLYNANGHLYDDFLFSFSNNKILNLHLNHYMLMSEEYYQKIKCTRGGGESGNVYKYSMKCFHDFNKTLNKLTDNELINKKKIVLKLKNNHPHKSNELINNQIKNKLNLVNNKGQHKDNKQVKQIKHFTLNTKVEQNQQIQEDKQQTTRKQNWYAFRKFFKKNNDNKSIICIENTFIKINEEHSSNLDDTQKIRVFQKMIFPLIYENKSYFIIDKNPIVNKLTNVIL